MTDDNLRNEARVLAIMAMQSDRYGDDMDFRNQVDTVYALVENKNAPDEIDLMKVLTKSLKEKEGKEKAQTPAHAD